MPLFEYQCQKCGRSFEKATQLGEAPSITCPACGSDSVKKVFSPFASFRGTGSSAGQSSCVPSG